MRITCRVGVSLVKLPDLEPAPFPLLHVIVQSVSLTWGFMLPGAAIVAVLRSRGKLGGRRPARGGALRVAAGLLSDKRACQVSPTEQSWGSGLSG